MNSEDQKQESSKKFILRDDLGRFMPSTAPGPGRPPQRVNKLTILKNQLIQAFFEEDGVEKFRQMLRSPIKFERALKMLLNISKVKEVSYEMFQDAEGKKSLKVTREEDD